jgi:hypothetical protein
MWRAWLTIAHRNPSYVRQLRLRPTILTESLVSIGLFTQTLSIYNNKIAPNDGQAALNDNLLTKNGVVIFPLTVSAIWCTIMLVMTGYRVCTTAKKNREGSSGSEGSKTDVVVHLGVEVGMESIIVVLMAVVLGVVAAEIAAWKNGKMDDGTRVQLRDCPVINPATGKLFYYCTDDWKQLVNLSTSAVAQLGVSLCVPLPSVSFCR